MTTLPKRILSVGRYTIPPDIREEFYVAIHWFDGKPPVIQPCSEEKFFILLNQLLKDNKINILVEV
jgi:hypothetical protein